MVEAMATAMQVISSQARIMEVDELVRRPEALETRLATGNGNN